MWGLSILTGTSNILRILVYRVNFLILTPDDPVFQTLSYWGLGKNRFQIEVPDSAVKNVPRDYEVASQKKGFRRYRTATVDRLLATLVEAEEKRDIAIKDSMRRIFAAFDKK